MIETKVKAGAAGGSLAGLVTWILVSYVPAWHGGLPVQVAALLPVVLALAASTVSAYLAPHTVTPADPPSVPVPPA